MASGAGAGCGATAGVGVGTAGLGVGALACTLGCGAWGLGSGAGGAGGAMISTKISAGTTASATRRSKPTCIAQSTTTCKAITLTTIEVLRLMAGKALGRGKAGVDMLRKARGATGGCVATNKGKGTRKQQNKNRYCLCAKKRTT